MPSQPLTLSARTARPPHPAAVLELLKPITWFPPVWAFACGLVSGGISVPGGIPTILAGLVLAGPLLCGASQAVNDWFDRDVDAINEPSRPIPSGRVGGAWGLVIALAMSCLALLVAAALGRLVFLPALLGTALSWAYSAPPLRLKRNGWFGNAAVALSYEGLAWIGGAALASGKPPSLPIVVLALLYSLGSHGIMTLNDFKSIAGDRASGVGSLPVRLGVGRAVTVACVFMLASQFAAALALVLWGAPVFAALIAVLILGQGAMMPRLLRDPDREAARYNATGTLLFVAGMMVAAVAIRQVLA